MEKENLRIWEYYNDIKVIPKKIDELYENEVIVIGTNEAGIHGAGAAYQAHKEFGAKSGMGFGYYGQTFAIPTKDWKVKTLPLTEIKFYVKRFIAFAKSQPQLKFLVTPIGTGLAGYSVEDIAPMFRMAAWVENIILPKEFVEYLGERYSNV